MEGSICEGNAACSDCYGIGLCSHEIQNGSWCEIGSEYKAGVVQIGSKYKAGAGSTK